MLHRRGLLAGALAVVAGGAQAQLLRPAQPSGARAGFRFLSTDDVDVAAYISALTTPPSAAERSRLNSLVTGLKADGVWPPLDRLNVLAAETQQAGLRDLRNPTKTLTVGGTVTFTADRGFAGDGTTGYLDLGEAFAATGNQFALNSSSMGVWCNAQTSGGAMPQIGNLANSPRSTITPRSTAGNELFQANDSSTDVLMASPLSRVGHRAWSRTGAAVKRGFFNGSRTADLTTASVAVNTTNGCLLRSGTSFTDDRFAAFWSGAGLTDAQQAALHSRISAYLSGKGAA
ncbi:hypothetical protein MMB17_18530 [Methylobacterium organophilum]|uniref:hypothetical protein n=1 Tax=Methylobacterium organophilum TaxID=410 RepID=UPI001F132C30|nr:hypothetical protein [Methylobacterium organophilum]UMY16659.1 hypothetical protein MMB17_18530 [Methylobacterium organophilum]